VGCGLPVRGRALSSPLKPRGLFWTFAGVFLLVLVAFTALAVLTSVTILHPIAAQRARDRTELALDRAARQIAALPDPYDLSELRRVLRANPLGDADALLVLSAWDGRVIPDRTLPAESMEQVVRLLAGAGLADSAAARAASGIPPGAAGVGEAALAPLEVIGHRTVTIEGSRFGDVAAIGSAVRPSLLASPESRALLLFMPFAILASGVAGLVMVRILVARVRALEQFAARVTGGDLAARVAVQGDDEITRLEERLNVMTTRLEAARADLDRVDQQRRRLLGDITHELATPLTTIRGAIETLQNASVPKSPEEHAMFLRDALEETERLDLLVSELLELTRLEARAQPLKTVRLDWAALCRNAARRLAPRFTEAGLALHADGAEGSAWVCADGLKLERVVDNLLVNALRYVPAGGNVWITVAGGESRVRLTVADDGPGIADADLPHVFERFYRADSTRKQVGTGLGLAIVKEIVVQHGGEARAEAREPRGVAFVVTLPAAECEPGTMAGARA